jgi:MinD-like ATPase involved in chromosome partitioning or flagellar assembly/tetratricopeptide (TPR) repeat protein
MKTITFYSYKGGTGRSLALANAARYLARLGFKVVALDFDLEAPGLHYKFSTSADGGPLPVRAGVADYIQSFIVEGRVPSSLKDFTLDVRVPGVDKPLVHLIPAGDVPSREYWLKLSRINWNDLFYSKEAKGVQVFLELKSRISDELKPDFLLIDSRTGITEMGGVATTLLADKVICLVLPTPENLEGARAVLRSLRRSRRETGGGDLELTVALSRLPQLKDAEAEREITARILSVMNEEAEDLRDTLSFSQVFILHSEAGLEVREALRVGSGMSPDESVLLRDYLRLFANVVPTGLIEPRVGQLIRQAKEKLWEDPDAAVKEVEELAASFGHPEIYRALLRFYEVRNVSGGLVLKRAQRLWEVTGDSTDSTVWQAVSRAFEFKPRWRRGKEWFVNLDFVDAVWRDAGKRDPEFGMKLAEAYSEDERWSRAADLLLELMNTSEANPAIVSRCIASLDAAKRVAEAEALIQRFKVVLGADPAFVETWAAHVLSGDNKDALMELATSSATEVLRTVRPSSAAQLYFRSGLFDQASAIADEALEDVVIRPGSERSVAEVGQLFDVLGRWEEFEARAGHRFPPRMIEQARARRRHK